jgi:hypothetical protein
MRKADTRVFFEEEECIRVLEEAADAVTSRYGDHVDVVLESEIHHWYSVTPHNPAACPVSFGYDQWLDVEPAGGRWELDWTAEGVALFKQMLDSLAAGRIVEYAAGNRSRVLITLESGEVVSSNVSRGILSLFERLPREPSTRFEPWVRS